MWLALEGDRDLAVRFAHAATATFRKLALTPGLGSPIRSNNPALSAIRKWRVAGFANFLIFYRPDKDGIAIIRVLHTSQDWWGLLDLP